MRILGVRRFRKQKANTNNEDIKQMKMPDEGKMKKPKRLQHRLLIAKRLQHRLLIASEDKALKLVNNFLYHNLQFKMMKK